MLAGGHHVPTEDIIRRFYRSKKNFWYIYKNHADRWILFYNSDEWSLQVAIGEGDQFTVTRSDLYKLFLKDINTGGTQ